jgi:hypothetical protein
MLKAFDTPRQLTLHHHNIVDSALSLNGRVSTDIFSPSVSIKNQYSESELVAQLQRPLFSEFIRLTTGDHLHTSDVDDHPDLFLTSFDVSEYLI